MLIKLSKDWFGPGAVRYRARNNPHDVPDEYKDILPSGTEVLSAKEAKAALAAEEPEEAPKAPTKK